MLYSTGNCLLIFICLACVYFFFFFQAEDGIRDLYVTGVQTCALPICSSKPSRGCRPGRGPPASVRLSIMDVCGSLCPPARSTASAKPRPALTSPRQAWTSRSKSCPTDKPSRCGTCAATCMRRPSPPVPPSSEPDMPADPDVPADLVFQSVFQLCVTIAGAVLCACLAVVYLRKVRVERPAIGVFNGRDIGILVFFLATLPVIYLLLPRWAVTCLLALTFVSALSIGYRNLVGPLRLWLGIGLLL